VSSGRTFSSHPFAHSIALAAGGFVAAVVAPRLGRHLDRRRRATPSSTPATPPVTTATRDEEAALDPGLAHRRAAIVLHQRTFDAALSSVADRDQLERELVDGALARTVVAVILHDIDVVADQFGAPAHDELLEQAVRRVRSIVREPTGVHRVGDSELIAVINGDRYVADAIARRITEAFATSFSIGGIDLVPGVGVGLAEVDLADPNDAIRRADLAAHRAAHEHT
jgi:GGDEF domain-containing protein